LTLRRLARVSFDRAAAATGLLALAESRMRGELTVITFHRVLPDALFKDYLFPSLAVCESMFRGQMQSLARRCRVVTLEEGMAAMHEGSTGPKPMVAVTFDDGYADNVRVAAPIMNALGLRATFFVVAGLIGTDAELWYDVAARRWQHATPERLVRACAAAGVDSAWMTAKPAIGEWMAFLKRLEPVQRANVVAELSDPGPSDARRHLDRLMTVDELRELRDAGHVIGSHSMSHPLLPQLDADALEAELVESRKLLERWLRTPVRGFSYPNGDQDDRVRAAVAHAQCTYACTTRTGRNDRHADPLRLSRIDMHPSRSSGLNGEFDEPSFRAAISLIHPFPRSQ
jgi:peptidoglycan/xylan/chitin deacetylase (PgdA/CDA1 family)